MPDQNDVESLRGAWQAVWSSDNWLMASYLHYILTGIPQEPFLLCRLGWIGGAAPYDMCCIESFGAICPMLNVPAPVISTKSDTTKLTVNPPATVSGDDKVQSHSTASANLSDGSFDYSAKYKRSVMELPSSPASSRPSMKDKHQAQL
ncbi:uncharacterized protein PgNI_02587 [Pyricularia grisea]|uniref:Uncharacterized protein n=1 Tax=Pyricularia grisea TaxID=148305 RepID=A0A6P8BKY5_PYRGI|nr:uncharacterized protein PgNI_02587 [Pyricularia grisea]TLD17354.1 hypothetical protein PgNI_02587 [Pyricularia grisea]